MQLFYNDIALHDYGQIVIASENSVGEPETAPQAWRKTLRVRLMFKETTYADNRALAEQVMLALRTQQAVLRWVDDAGGEKINQTATVIGHDRPEQPNEKGTYFQTLEITFQYYDVFDADKNSSVQATFKRTGPSTPTITLGFVERFKYDTDVKRYSPLHSHREMASGKLSMSGKFRADPLASLSDRRAALLAAVDQMRLEIKQGMDGTLVFASFNQIIRVENFSADYDQHMDSIAFSLSATFTEFPNESSYAQAEFSIDTRQDFKEGKTFLALSGSILAESQAHAVTKLNSIRTSVAAGFTMLRGGGGRAEQVDGEDGATFIRLSFDEEFEKTISNLVEWELRMADSDDPTSGFIRRTYSGHVTAVSADFQTAYNTATAKARLLGEHRHQFKLSGSVTCDDKQFSSQRQMTGNLVVSVEYSFEYRLKSQARIYAEVNSEFNGDLFALDLETVSGFVVASTADTARSIYSIIRSGYGAYSIRNERVSESRQKIEIDSGSPIDGQVGTTKSPAALAGNASIDVNVSEVKDDASEPVALARGPLNPPSLGSGYGRQWNRLEFSFVFVRPKISVSIRYEMVVTSDYVQRTITTNITGTVTAASGSLINGGVGQDAQATLTSFLDGFADSIGVGSPIMTKRTFGYEKSNVTSQDKITNRDLTTAKQMFLQMSFEDTYIKRMTGSALILESNVREEVKCSGPRIIVQPTAQENDVFQSCGVQSGKRTVSGSVTATDETAAFTFINKMRTLPINSAHLSPNGDSQSLPPEFSIEYRQVPLVELVPRNPGAGGDAIEWTGKATVVAVGFSFEEVFQGLTLP